MEFQWPVPWFCSPSQCLEGERGRSIKYRKKEMSAACLDRSKTDIRRRQHYGLNFIWREALFPLYCCPGLKKTETMYLFSERLAFNLGEVYYLNTPIIILAIIIIYEYYYSHHTLFEKVSWWGEFQRQWLFSLWLQYGFFSVQFFAF